MQVTEDIRLVDGIRGANAYLVSTPDGAMLVDSGLPGAGSVCFALSASGRTNGCGISC